MKEKNGVEIYIEIPEELPKYPRIDDDGYYVSGPAPSISGTLLAFAGVIFVLWLLGEFVLWLGRVF